MAARGEEAGRHASIALRLGAFFWLALPALLAAQPPSANEPHGTSDRKARAEAARAIPWNRLSPSLHRQVEWVVRDPTIYRRLPRRVVACEPELYQFLTRNPDSLVAIWDYMKVTQISVRRTGPFSFESDDGMGTISRFDLVYGRPELQLFVGRGEYEGPLIPGKLTGYGVAILRSQWTSVPEHGPRVRSEMDVFLRIDSGPVDLVARTLAPLCARNVDYNFTESADFIARLSESATSNPAGLQELITKLDRLHPIVRREFLSVSRNIEARQADVPSATARQPEPRTHATRVHYVPRPSRPEYEVMPLDDSSPAYRP